MTLEEAQAQLSKIKRLTDLKAKKEEYEKALLEIMNPANIQAQVCEDGRRTFEILKEVFVTKDIRVDGMHRNLIPPPGVVGSRGLVIKEPESQLGYIQRTSPEAEEMIKKLKFTIEARNDVEQARKIVRDNLDDGGM
ncbi:hypothetical protein Tco_1178534 [Tanacetum coccineum]